MRQRPQGPGVGVVVKLSLRSLEIPPEAFGFLGAGDGRTACQHDQPRCQVIATAVAEFLGHVRRPVLRPDFPTVNMHRAEYLAGVRCHIIDQFAEEAIEVPTHGFGVELVAFQAQPALG